MLVQHAERENTPSQALSRNKKLTVKHSTSTHFDKYDHCANVAFKLSLIRPNKYVSFSKKCLFIINIMDVTKSI